MNRLAQPVEQGFESWHSNLYSQPVLSAPSQRGRDLGPVFFHMDLAQGGKEHWTRSWEASVLPSLTGSGVLSKSG